MSNYCIFFSGETHDEFTLEDVKSNFKIHLELSEIQVNDYFSGSEIMIKSHLTQTEALNLIVELEGLGGACYFLPIEDLSLPVGVPINRRNEHRRNEERRKRIRRTSTLHLK